MFLKRCRDVPPNLAQVFLTVLGEKRCEAALFKEMVRIIFLRELLNLPVIDVVGVPCCR